MTHFEGELTMYVKMYGDDVAVRVEYEGHRDQGEYDWDKIDVVMVTVDVTKPYKLMIPTIVEVQISDEMLPEQWVEIDTAVIADMRARDER